MHPATGRGIDPQMHPATGRGIDPFVLVNCPHGSRDGRAMAYAVRANAQPVRAVPISRLGSTP